MTLPNKLSLSRILVIPIFLFCLLFDHVAPGLPWTTAVFRTFALVLVILATITDYWDGRLARERNLVTNLGKLLDPLADKILVCSAFIAFVDLKIYPGWVVIIILVREFVVTGIRSIGAAQGRVIHANRWGKHKTGWQLATIITAITFLAARDYLSAGGVWEQPLVSAWRADMIFSGILWTLAVICLALTLLSGWVYAWANRDLLREEAAVST